MSFVGQIFITFVLYFIMKLTNFMSKGVYATLIGVSIFAVSLFVMVNSVHAVNFSALFSPAADATNQDATTDITISFDRAVYADGDETVFTSTTLADVITLKTTDARGTDIAFSASISADNTSVTIDPTADLPVGVVYVAVSDGHYDAEGSQGDAVSSSFSVARSTPPVEEVSAPVEGAGTQEGAEGAGTNTNTPPADTTAPTVTIAPADGTTVTDNTQDITLTFSEAIVKDSSGTAFADADLAGILTLKSTDASGADIAYSATINADATAITIDPADDLADGVVYAAITDGYYDGSGNQGSAATASFTVAVPVEEVAEPVENTEETEEETPPTDTTAPTVTISPADGATVTDASTDVVLTFSEAVYQDAADTVFDATTLASIVTLKVTDANGSAIAYSASINADNTSVTIDPDGDLADGVVYAAVTDGYYDAADNQGSAATASFTVAVPVEEESSPVEGAGAQGAGTNTNTPPADTTAPTVTIAPADGATVTDNTQNITLSFSEAIKKDASGTDFADADLAGILTLKSTDASGTDIAYAATISGNTITIDPTDDLADGVVYAAITDGYYDGSGNQGSAATVSFTVAVPVEEESTPVNNPPVSEAQGAGAGAGAQGSNQNNQGQNQGAGAGANAGSQPPADTIAPLVRITPLDGSTVTDATTNVVLAFSEAIYQDAADTAFDATTLAGIITLKSTDANGADIAYSASINTDNTIVTVDPTANFADGAVYAAITNGYYDAADNQGSAATSTFTVAVPPPTPPADTTAPTVTIAPADGATVTDASTDVVLTFSEAVYQDVADTVFDATTLAGIVTLKVTDANGSAIAYSASINADNTSVTIDPDGDLADGVVYAAVTDGYYDAADNQGSAATASFTVAVPPPTPPADTTAPTVTIAPADASTITDNTQDITLTFSEAIKEDAKGADFADADLSGILTLKSTDASGTDIAYSATINSAGTTITIDPTDALADGVVYAAITDGYYDGSGNQGSAATASFTVAVPVALSVTSSPANRETVTDASTNIVLTFNRPVYKDIRGTAFTTKDLASFVVLRTDDVYGYGISFGATMSADNTTITIDPTNPLTDGKVYVAISGDYYDANDTRGTAFKATFTADVGNPPQMLDDFFSYLLLNPASQISSGTNVIGVPMPPIQPDESLREQKIEEALSLLWQALESLSVVVAIDSIDVSGSSSNSAGVPENTTTTTTTTQTNAGGTQTGGSGGQSNEGGGQNNEGGGQNNEDEGAGTPPDPSEVIE